MSSARSSESRNGRPALDVRDAVRRPGFINRMLPRYLAVTPEAIREVAAAVFRPDNRVVLTYLPEGTTEDDVALAPTPRPRAATDEEVAA